MRVISGSARGCGLDAPKGMRTRPTADRLKENLFNLLASRIRDARFLDLFSGSGAIGIEALSRGAHEAVFVENEPSALTVIKANLIKTRLTDRAELLPMKTKQAINKLVGAGRQFDIIFMDPPYAGDLAAETIGLIIQQPLLLAEDGMIAAETDAKTQLPHFEDLTVVNTKIYGSTAFTLYAWKQAI